jgi:CO/xanthine dehydrogenase FAD-binding subunit
MTVREYLLPQSLPEALGLLAERGPELLVMAGGTVAMPLINEGLSLPSAVMGLRHAGLAGIERVDGAIRIGAMTTIGALLDQTDLPLLGAAARETGAWAVRNMGTAGGNLFTPPPGGDVAVALLALDARLTIASARGERDLPIGDFFTGFMANALAADELVTAITVPLSGDTAVFRKLGRKHANTPAVVSVAVRLVRDGEGVADARIALGGVGPHPIRAWAAEQIIVERGLGTGAVEAAAAAAADGCDPATDAIATAWYRRRMCELEVRRALGQAAAARDGSND